MAVPQKPYRNKLACPTPVEKRADGLTNILVALHDDMEIALSQMLSARGVKHFIHPNSRGDRLTRNMWIVFFDPDDTSKVYDAIDAMP